MGLSKNITEYEDCREHLDRALTSAKGIRINLPSRGQAIHLRQRMYKLRQMEKAKSIDLYEMGDERRNRSAYDNLTITVVGDSIEVRHADPVTVEEL